MFGQYEGTLETKGLFQWISNSMCTKILQIAPFHKFYIALINRHSKIVSEVYPYQIKINFIILGIKFFKPGKRGPLKTSYWQNGRPP